MPLIERNERYLPIDAPPPVPDISELLRQQKELFVDILELYFKRVGYITTLGALMKLDEVTNVSYSEELNFEIKCSGPNNEQLDLIHWRQFNVNGKWVGNVHGMEKYISELCWQDFLSRLEEFLEIGT